LAQASQTLADAAGPVGPDVVAACALSSVPGLGASALGRIAARFGSLRQALEEGPGAIAEGADELELRPQARQYLAEEPHLYELAAWALQAARKAGARVLLPGDATWPGRLGSIRNPPRLLYVRGTLGAQARRIAVVGSRDTDEAGLVLARLFADGFARAGVEVVSGGARGIDTAAHEGALWGEGRSIAVLGSGIDVAYPALNRNLFDRLAHGGGAVVSEFAPGTQPGAGNFPRRNRIVAGLSDAVVVIRAALRSGALITADHALEQGAALFAVPGDPGQRKAEGPNALLRAGQARLASRPADVLRELEWPVPALLEAVDATRSPPPASYVAKARPEPERELLDAAGAKLWRLLDERTPAHVDDLALRAQIPAREALGKLAELELKGMALQRPGKYFLRR
jgi:DNA processing protein